MDSALYLAAARSYATGEQFAVGSSARPNVPPVTPYYLAVAYKIAEIAAPNSGLPGKFLYFNLFGGLAGLAGLLAAFLLAVELGGGRRALVVLLLLSTSSSYYSLSTQPMTEVPYCAISWGALLFLVRLERRGGWGNALAAGILVILAPMTRAIGAALALSALALYARRALGQGVTLKSNSTSLLAALPGALILPGFFLYILRTADAGTFSYVHDLTYRSLLQAPAIVTANASELLAKLPAVVMGRGSLLAAGVLIAAILVVGASVWRQGRGRRLLSLYLLLYVAFLIISVPEVNARYLVPLLPFIYLLAMDGLSVTGEWASGALSRARRWGGNKRARIQAAWGKTAVVAACLVVAANLAGIGSWLSPQFSKDFYKAYEDGYYADYMPLAHALAAGSPTGPVMARQARLLAALTGARAYSPPYLQFSKERPSAEETSRFVRERGIMSVVVDPRNGDSARVLRELVERGSLKWREAASYGTLTVYVREG